MHSPAPFATAPALLEACGYSACLWHQKAPGAVAGMAAPAGLSAVCVAVVRRLGCPLGSEVGAAHAGWKGAINGITDNTIAAMEKLGAHRDRIVCAIGPCILQKSYEVDEGFFRRFVEADEANERFFADGKAQHYQFDIEGYVAARLASAGIRRIACLSEDTYSQPERFYSYRRSCHKNEAGYGRQISLIGLKAI